MPSFGVVSERGRERWSAEAFRQAAREDWKTWWEALRCEPGKEQLFAERERRFSSKVRPDSHTMVELHQAALRGAGFREVGVIWQHLDNRVVMAVH